MATQVKTKTDTPKTFHYIHGYPLVGNLLEFRKDRLRPFTAFSARRRCLWYEFRTIPHHSIQ